MPARDRALDGLRGIAVLMVIVLHTVHFDKHKVFFKELNRLIGTGWMGVDLFFVLSGFLITRILIQTRDDPARARNFYMRRALRILPAYYFYLLCVFAVLWLLPGLATRFSQSLQWVPHFLFFTQNLATAAGSEAAPVRELTHLWSLAVEEQFYLFWPWLVWRLRTEDLPRMCIRVVLIAWGFKLLLAAFGVWWHAIYVLPFTRMDGFAIGAYLAAHQLLGRSVFPAWIRPLPWLGFWLLVAQYLAMGGLHDMSAAETAIATSSTVLMFGGVLHRALTAPEHGWLDRALGNRVLIFFGAYSYGLYLIHYGVDTAARAFVQPLIQPYLTGNRLRLLIAAGGLATSVGLAVLMHRLVEQPALRLKRHFKSPSALPASPQRMA